MKRILSVILAVVLLAGSAVTVFASEQHRITRRIPLLDENGKLTEPGYCTENLYEYDRKAIKARPTRIKEWDFYQVTDGRDTGWVEKEHIKIIPEEGEAP